MSGRADHYETLFGNLRQTDLDMGVSAAIADAGPDLWPTVAIAGFDVDFRRPSAVRDAAQLVLALATVDERRAALDQVPEHFRETVRIFVQRAFYNKRAKGTR